MALRLMEIHVPGVAGERITEILKDRPTEGIWQDKMSETETLVKVLLPSEETEGVLDLLDQHFSRLEGFQVILLPVEAVFPRPEEAEEAPPRKPGPSVKRRLFRISREELYEDVRQAARLSPAYVLLVALSSVVAAIGILRNDVIILIGAMVIAPLLGPNAALALATTLGDARLARKALSTNAAGILTAVGIGAAVGLLLNVDPALPQIAFRTGVDIQDVLLAVAAGSAGAIAFTIVIPTVLVGVMVAVALLPPSVILGMLLGSGYQDLAFGTVLLLFVYLVGINLSGVTTFLAQGVRPMSWWEAERARRATRLALISWILLLVVLILLIRLS